MKKITILGVSGSIGTQAVDVIKAHQDLFKLVAISVNKNVDLAIKIAEELKVKHICLASKIAVEENIKKYPDFIFHYGEEGLKEIATLSEVDIVLNSIIGFAGLKPTIAAIESKKDIALANKETLVVAGELIMNLVKKHQINLLPVDSEHSAIFQCLNGENKNEINRLIITASGGSFRDRSRNDLKNVTVAEALNHPNWSMGAGITIDSATMFNKGLEVIEAKWLFDLSYDQIDVVIHPESIIHSMVEFRDYSTIAQLSNPDMRMPIQYAFTYPNREKLFGVQPLDFTKIRNLTFSPVDMKRFPALELSYQVGRIGGSLPAVLNGAKEKAVELFLNNKIQFLDIEWLVQEAINKHQVVFSTSLKQLIEADHWARNYVIDKVGGKHNADII